MLPRSLASLLLLTALAVPLGLNASEPKTSQGAQSLAAFEVVAKVLKHPRCRNCHPQGDRPLQGDPPRPHRMNIQRRLAQVGMACGTCHQQKNSPGLHRPPGAPHWQLAPKEQIFEGRSTAELCRQLRAPETNGQRSLDDLLHHLTKDPLVLWGWAPGQGRKPVPVSQKKFAAAVKAWIEHGAHCPPVTSQKEPK